VALALGIMIAVGAPATMTALTAAACAAWVIRDGRMASLPRLTDPQALRVPSDD
jgi:hypothetical protein